MRSQKILNLKLVSVREVSELTETSSPKCPSGPASSSLISLPTETPIDKFRTSSSHKKQIILSPQSRAEIHWWIYNFTLNDGKSLYEKALI